MLISLRISRRLDYAGLGKISRNFLGEDSINKHGFAKILSD